MIRHQTHSHLISHDVTIAQAWQYYARYVSNWGSERVIYRFDGKNDGKTVITATKAAYQSLHLDVKKPFISEPLTKDDMMTLRIPVTVINQHGERARYLFEPLQIKVDGPASLLHDETIAFEAGQTAVWLKVRYHELSKLFLTLTWRDQNTVIDF